MKQKDSSSVYGKLIPFMVTVLVVVAAAHLLAAQDSKKVAKGKSATSANVAAEAKRQQQTESLAVQVNVVFQSQLVCAGSPVPTGWITTNDQWNPTTCGNPTSITYNVWQITQYSGMPVGSVLNVCANYQAVPNGWVMVGGSWNPTSCGHPTSIVNNVSTIKRL